MPDRLIIADRSELAGNMYRLLLAPLGVEPVVKRRFEEARPFLFRPGSVKLAIFNSNIFGKNMVEIVKQLESESILKKVSKIFICSEIQYKEDVGKILGKMTNTYLITKPFHPDMFLELVERLINYRGEL